MSTISYTTQQIAQIDNHAPLRSFFYPEIAHKDITLSFHTFSKLKVHKRVKFGSKDIFKKWLYKSIIMTHR